MTNKVLTALSSVSILRTDTGKEYAQIISGELSSNGSIPIPLTSPATYFGKYKFNVDTTFELDDSDIITHGGIAYWGVTLVRR